MVARGEERGLLHRAQDLARQRVHLLDAVDLVPEPLDPHDAVVPVGGPDLEDVAAHAERAAAAVHVVAPVLDLDEAPQHLVAVHPLAPSAGTRCIAAYSAGEPRA